MLGAIKNGKELRPYICIAPHVAMPHARPEQGALKTQLAVTLFRNEIVFNREDARANLFISLAAADADSQAIIKGTIKTILGFIVLARFSRWKYIFLTGHHALYMACLITIILSIAGLEGWQLTVGGAMLLGFVMAMFPALMQPTMEKITGDDSLALGHFGSSCYFISAQIGKIFGGGIVGLAILAVVNQSGIPAAIILPGAADLFICGDDLLPKAQKAGQAIGLANMVSMPEMTAKLKEVFGK